MNFIGTNSDFVFKISSSTTYYVHVTCKAYLLHQIQNVVLWFRNSKCGFVIQECENVFEQSKIHKLTSYDY